MVRPGTHLAARAVLVTGASTGIGAAAALYIAERGLQVFAGVRQLADGDRLKEKSPHLLSPIVVDVTQSEQIAAAVDQVTQAVGESGLLGIVNNAGIAVAGPLEFLPIEELRRQLEVNVIGAVAVTQAFLPLLRQSKGRIVNISSFAGSVSSPFLAPYHASKFALEAISDALRMELHPWGIHIAVIKPGSVKTPIWSKARSGGNILLKRLPPQAINYYGKAIDILTERTRMNEETGVDTVFVSKAIYHALTAKKPRTRYLVNINPVTLFFLRLIPDRLRDHLILRHLGFWRQA